MIFNHLVKHNGIYYPAGTDVPVEEEAKKEQPIVQEKEKEEPKKEVKFPYNKTQINRMSTAELKAVAKDLGMDDNLSGSEIKATIIKKYL